MKPFVYFNCVVSGLFKEASSYTQRERERERERERGKMVYYHQQN